MDQAAFRSFYQKTAPAVRAYIARSCGSIDIADDLLQEAFIRLLGKAPSSLNEASMRSYLYRIADSLIVDYWRRSKRESARDREAARQRIESVEPDVHGDMDRAFQQLPPQQRSLLWLAYVEEFDHRQIAATVGVREKSVRVLLFRARRALAKILDRAGLGPEVADAK